MKRRGNAIQSVVIAGLVIALVVMILNYAGLSGRLQQAQYSSCTASNSIRYKTIGIISEVISLPSSVKPGVRDPARVARRSAAIAKLKHDTVANFGQAADCGSP